MSNIKINILEILFKYRYQLEKTKIIYLLVYSFLKLWYGELKVFKLLQYFLESFSTFLG